MPCTSNLLFQGSDVIEQIIFISNGMLQVRFFGKEKVTWLKLSDIPSGLQQEFNATGCINSYNEVLNC